MLSAGKFTLFVGTWFVASVHYFVIRISREYRHKTEHMVMDDETVVKKDIEYARTISRVLTFGFMTVSILVGVLHLFVAWANTDASYVFAAYAVAAGYEICMPMYEASVFASSKTLSYTPKFSQMWFWGASFCMGVVASTVGHPKSIDILILLPLIKFAGFDLVYSRRLDTLKPEEDLWNAPTTSNWLRFHSLITVAWSLLILFILFEWEGTANGIVLDLLIFARACQSLFIRYTSTEKRPSEEPEETSTAEGSTSEEV
jgi:hypothetical protein